MLDEAVETLLQGMEKMFEERDVRLDGLDSKVGGVDKRIDRYHPAE